MKFQWSCTTQLIITDNDLVLRDISCSCYLRKKEEGTLITTATLMWLGDLHTSWGLTMYQRRSHLGSRGILCNDVNYKAEENALRSRK